MNKEALLAGMMFGGQAGGGGGGSSDVLNVTAKITIDAGATTATYSRTAQEAIDAVTNERGIDLKIVIGSMTVPTVQVPSSNYIDFVPFGVDYQSNPIIVRLHLVSQEWTLVANSAKNQGWIPYYNNNHTGAVPSISNENKLSFYDITSRFPLDGSIATLIGGAIAYKGTAIGSTITDPTTLSELSTLLAEFKQAVYNCHPIQITDIGFGTTYYFDAVSYSIDQHGNFLDILLKTSMISAGNLENITININYSYDPNDDTTLTQAQIAAYCDSHPITFM